MKTGSVHKYQGQSIRGHADAGRGRRTLALLGLLFLLVGAASHARALLQSAANDRWDFLRTNLGVFPGTEQLFEPDSRLFWRLKPNLQGIQAAEKLPGAEYPFTVSTDRHGRRHLAAPAKVHYRVLFLGDSVTFGIPVNDNETLPALVQRKLNRRFRQGMQCINAGVPGYSAFQGRLQLEQWTDPPPDAVVITFWPNGRSSWDHLSDAEHEQLLVAERKGEFSRHRLTRLLRRVTPGTRPRLTEEEFAEQVRLMLRWCQERGAAPVVQVWPVQRQTVEDVEIERQQILRTIARKDGAALVDLVPVFRKRGDPQLFADSVHATKAGYALAADALRPVLQDLIERRDSGREGQR